MGLPCLRCLPVTTLFWLFHVVNASDLRHRPGSVSDLWFMGVQEGNLALIHVWILIPALLTCVSDLGQVTCVWPTYVMKACCIVTKWCLTLMQPCGLWSPRLLCPWDSQTRILEWVAIPFSRGSSWPRESNLGLLHCRQILYHLSHQGSPNFSLLLLLLLLSRFSCVRLCVTP